MRARGEGVKLECKGFWDLGVQGSGLSVGVDLRSAGPPL